MSSSIEIAVQEVVESIRRQMEARSHSAANELRNAAQEVLRGSRSGRTYRVPGTKRSYTASAPGEPPAVRTGEFRLSWQPKARVSGDAYISSVESNVMAGKYVLGEILEDGTPGGQMQPRPHHEKIREKAEPYIVRIYSRDYF